MRRMAPVLLFFVMIQLTASIEIVGCQVVSQKPPQKRLATAQSLRLLIPPMATCLQLLALKVSSYMTPKHWTKSYISPKSSVPSHTIAFSPDGTLLASGGRDAYYSIVAHRHPKADTRFYRA